VDNTIPKAGEGADGIKGEEGGSPLVQAGILSIFLFLPPPTSLLSGCHEVATLLHDTLSTMMLCLTTGSQRWTETSETVRQNKIFLF
jgi:hypothetical protein